MTIEKTNKWVLVGMTNKCFDKYSSFERNLQFTRSLFMMPEGKTSGFKMKYLAKYWAFFIYVIYINKAKTIQNWIVILIIIVHNLRGYQQIDVCLYSLIIFRDRRCESSFVTLVSTTSNNR
jgi:hypothetical protein